MPRCLWRLQLTGESSTIGATALHYAAKYGHLDVVRVLLERGCDKDAKTWVRATLLLQLRPRRSAVATRVLC